jgi:uncharacterized protein (TIGR02266 family)
MSTAQELKSDGVAGSDRVADRRDFAAEIELSNESEHSFYTGFTENISSGGLFVATRDLKPIGTVMEISFSLPGSGVKITTRCEVRWQRLEQPNADSMPGIGLRFLDIDATAAEAINTFIGTRGSLFYDDE